MCGHVRTQLSRPNFAPRQGREPKRAEGRGTKAGGEWGRALEAKAEGFDGWRRMGEHKDALNRKGPSPRPCLGERPFVRVRACVIVECGCACAHVWGRVALETVCETDAG